jgi:predicted phosphodiesterase
MPTLSNSDPKSYELRPMGDAEMDEINRRYRFAVAQSTDQFQPQDFDYMDSIRKSLDEFAPTWRAMAAWRPPPVDIAFIGDLHGNMKDWLKLRRSFKRTIQVGDLGAGFAELPPEENGHTWIRGNHDSPDIACTRGDYLGDFGMRDGVFFVSGAASIDRDQRTPGVDWWADEELSDAQMHEALKLYAETRPSLVVSHCAPREAELVIGSSWRGCRTSYWLQRMLDLHRPRLWVFGHYHEKHDKTVDGTRFLCVPKNQVLLVEYPR